MSNNTIIVFTGKSIDTLLREGGTSSWRLDRNHARQCTFAVCTRNSKIDWVEGQEQHGSAFLIGKVGGVVPTPEDERSRYLIQFSEYTLVNLPETWKGDRNPVKYGTLEQLGIDPSKLEWKPMPAKAQPRRNATQEVDHRLDNTAVRPLSMDLAKRGLALTFGVRPEAIEITIRG